MSEHSLILEFYKPTYNLDFDYNDDGGLNLHFTSIKGEFFMTMENSFDGIYFDDVDCQFYKGEMFASVDLGDLVERIVNGEFRQTDGKAISDWIKRFLGDGEEKIEFNGKNYADGSLFWDDFFKEMPKDEIKDFLRFCEDYLYLPNIEVDTVSNKWDFENGKVELKSNDKWGIGISDDYNIISVDEFTCDSKDAYVSYVVASSESDEDDFYESKKSTKRSLTEGISAFNKAIAKKYNDTEPNGAGQYYLDWRFDLHDEKDNIEAIADRCGVTVEFQSDEGYFEVFEESKKSTKKSLKESFEYDGTIPLEELMNILDDEWKYSNNGGVFGNSSHWDDESRDEGKYIEISAIVDFNSASNWGFSNKRVQKLYDDECNKIYKEVDEDYDKYDEIINEYEPILFLVTIDLKEKIIYADVDLGNGLGSTEVARERLAENENDFRKQIQRMIDSF